VNTTVQNIDVKIAVGSNFANTTKISDLVESVVGQLCVYTGDKNQSANHVVDRRSAYITRKNAIAKTVMGLKFVNMAKSNMFVQTVSRSNKPSNPKGFATFVPPH